MTAIDDGDLDVLDGELLDDEPDRQLALLGDEDLSEDAAADTAGARPERTSKTYDEQWTYFLRWCAANRRRPGPKTAGLSNDGRSMAGRLRSARYTLSRVTSAREWCIDGHSMIRFEVTR
ncbi:hypothetical protein ACIHEI_28950 [Kitasatospora sp. NPDC051984]|uniref:hypothetical protein n=1 Tax=Kitasatospora sp. NPDC051984 TaxID=3364059 RepID=UPI0037C97509